MGPFVSSLARGAVSPLRSYGLRLDPPCVTVRGELAIKREHRATDLYGAFRVKSGAWCRVSSSILWPEARSSLRDGPRGARHQARTSRHRLVWGLSCQVWRVVPCLLFDLMA